MASRAGRLTVVVSIPMFLEEGNSKIRLTNAIENMGNDLANKIVALLESIPGKVSLVLSLVRAQHLAQMGVATHDDNAEHDAFAALSGVDGFVQRVGVAIAILEWPYVALFLPRGIQCHQDGFAELVCLELLVHTASQRVAVPLVLECVLDLANFVVLTAHERFDEELAARRVGLVPVVGPVALALVLSKRRHVRNLSKVTARLQLDVLGNVDAPALNLAMSFVFCSQLEQLVMRKRRNDVDNGVHVGCSCRHGFDECKSIISGIVYPDSALLLLLLLLLLVVTVVAAICLESQLISMFGGPRWAWRSARRRVGAAAAAAVTVLTAARIPGLKSIEWLQVVEVVVQHQRLWHRTN